MSSVLVWFQVYQDEVPLPVSASVLTAFCTRDRQTFSDFQQLQQQLSTVSAAIISSAHVTKICVSADM